jgi:Fe-S-cluster containining protein
MADTHPTADLDTLIPSLCTRCGKCCLNESYMGNLTASPEDVDRWHRQGRADILRFESLGDLWVDDEDRERTRCPFLRKDRCQSTYKCRIYDTRPADCRNYPQTYGQMVDDGCEIIGELEKLGIDATGWMRAERRSTE